MSDITVEYQVYLKLPFRKPRFQCFNYTVFVLFMFSLLSALSAVDWSADSIVYTLKSFAKRWEYRGIRIGGTLGGKYTKFSIETVVNDSYINSNKSYIIIEFNTKKTVSIHQKY